MMITPRSRVTNFPLVSQILQTYEPWVYQWLIGTERCLKMSVVPQMQDVPLEIEGAVEIWGPGVKLFCLKEKLEERVVEKEIDVDALQASVSATDEEVKQWLALLLEDYDIEPNEDNMEAASYFIRSWLERQALARGLSLSEDELSKLFSFTVRLAYEALYVGSV